MRIIGVDPGIALMGYGIIEGEAGRQRLVEHGALSTAADLAPEVRLQALYRGLGQLLQTYRPAAVAVENLYFGRNVTTAITVGQARGVVLLAAAEAGLPVREYTPMQVKQAVVGYGKADKQQVQHMVRALLNLSSTPRPDDVADALAVALCCLQSWAMEQRLGGLRP